MIKLIKALRRDLSTIFLLSLASILLIDFWLIDTPEIFLGGYKLGQIIYKVSLSYISAFIFYFLVVHMKQQKDKENLKSYLGKKTRMVIASYKAIIKSLAKESGLEVESEYLKDSEIKIICSKINPHAEAPLLLDYRSTKPLYANWIQYLAYEKRRSDAAIEKIFMKMPFLDTILVNKLANIEDCSYFMQIPQVERTMPIKNQDIQFLSNSIMKYRDMIADLENYINKNL